MTHPSVETERKIVGLYRLDVAVEDITKLTKVSSFGIYETLSRHHVELRSTAFVTSTTPERRHHTVLPYCNFAGKCSFKKVTKSKGGGHYKHVRCNLNGPCNQQRWSWQA